MNAFAPLGFALLLAGVAAAAGTVDAAVIPAQKLEALTVAVPFQVHLMTNVAV